MGTERMKCKHCGMDHAADLYTQNPCELKVRLETARAGSGMRILYENYANRLALTLKEACDLLIMLEPEIPEGKAYATRQDVLDVIQKCKATIIDGIKQ